MNEELCTKVLEAIVARPHDVLTMQLLDTYKNGGNATFDVLAVPSVDGRDVLSINVRATLADGDTYEVSRMAFVDDYIRQIDNDRALCPSELKGVEASQLGIARAVAHIFEERACHTALV